MSDTGGESAADEEVLVEEVVVEEVVVVGDTADDDAAPVEPASGGRAPGWLVWLLIVVATLVAVGASLNTWVNEQVLETDEWVEVSENLLEDDDIRNALATYLVAELFRTADVRSSLEELLPEEIGGLAGPLAATLESNAVPVADRLLATSAVNTTWSELNATAHEVFVRVVRDDLRDGLTTANGSFAIELEVLIGLVAERLGLSSDIIDGIADDAGQLVIFESDELDAIQQAVAVIELLSVLLFILVVVLYTAAVWLSRDRRRTLRNVGWALVVASVVLLIVRRLAVRVATEQLAEAESGRAAVSSIVTIATNLLNEIAWAGVAVGLLIVLYTVLVGPTSVAARIRRLAAPVLTNTWAIWGAAIVGLLLLLAFVPGFTLRTWVAGLVFVAMFAAAVESTRRFCVAEESAPAQSSDDTVADDSEYTTIG